MCRKLLLLLLLSCSLAFGQGAGIVNNYALATTPPMQWNEWPVFGCSGESAATIEAIADGIVYYGLNTAGYEYVGVDDCWMLATRGPDGNLQPNPGYFPQGMAAVAAYVHADGLKFGMYLSAGTSSCEGMAGSYGYEYQDAALMANYGADLIKWDAACNTPDAATKTSPTLRIAKAIAATGRSMLLTAGDDEYFALGASGAQTMRIGPDMTPTTWAQMLNAFTANSGIANYNGPGNWLDLDCLMTGDSGITDTQGQTSFAIWAIQGAPLVLGADLRQSSSPDAATIATLTNTDIIAVDQDALGIAGTEVSSVSCGSYTCQVWVKPLSGTNTCAIAMFNLDTAGAHDITATFSTIAAAYPQCGSGPYTTTRDLWAHSSLGTLTTSYTATSVPAYGNAMIKVAP
jgi:alpha-galactosidase